MMIKWQIILAVVAVLLAGGIIWGAEYLNNQSLQDMRQARSNYDAARSRVELIEQEEATIIEYIGRYQDLSDAGVVQDEDRLQMIERIADIRAEDNLFPVSFTMDEQKNLHLRYAPDVTDPGGPIDLRSSVLHLDLPLLHEEDLTRLLDGILSSPGLYQPEECEIEQQNVNATSFIILAQHFTASCEILWYTFNLNPPVEDPFGF